MDYLREINAFERWLETNYLPCLSQLLWYRLMALCNRAGWPEWVAVDNWRLMGMIQCKREATFIDIRDKLIEYGLIELRRGKKSFPNQYKINTFTSVVKSVVNTVAETEVKSVVQTVVQTVAETVDISSYPTDTQKTKTETKTKTNIAPDDPQKKKKRKAELTPAQLERFERFWAIWPHKKSCGQAEITWEKINPDDQETEEIIAGVRRAMQYDHRFQVIGKYTPHPSTWLNAAGWKDEFKPGSAGGDYDGSWH